MLTFKGDPNELVRLNPPIGAIKYVRFDHNGEFTTDNDRVIQRFHHHYDAMPSNGREVTPELTDDLELQPEPPKRFKCNQCEFSSDNKGVLLAHKKEHKEG